jgi:hypothetical protein
MGHRVCFVRFRRILLSIFCGLAFLHWQASKVNGQTSNADRAQLTQSQFGSNVTPEGFTDGHAAASPNDADLGEQEILKREQRYQPFTASVALPLYWTSNVALSRSHEKSDFIEAPVAGIYYEPRFTRTLYGLFDVREQLFYYDKYDSFNFGAFDVDVGLSCVLPQLENLILRAEYNYNRLTMKDSFDDFFSNHALIFSAELPFRFGRAQQLSFGTAANISMTADPEAPRRNDYEAFVGYTASLTRDFSINAVGRLVVRDYYHQDSRVDLSEILALTANYRVSKFFTASAISTFAASQSNHSVFDYEVANVGGAVSLSIKF